MNENNFNHYQTISLPSFKFFENIEMQEYSIGDGRVVCLDIISNASEILSSIEKLDYKPVGADGNAKNYSPEMEVVSGRASTYDVHNTEKLAEKLKLILSPDIKERKLPNSCVNSENKTYRFMGINPYIRFIYYNTQKKLHPHYDGHYNFSPSLQTTMTCLIYLTDNHSGKTQFLKDNRTLEEKKSLLSKPIEDSEILLSIAPRAGRVLLFDQYLLHSTQDLIGESKSLILTDYIMGC